MLEDRRGGWLTVLGAVLGPYIGVTFSLIAITYANVGIAATIMATTPVMMLPIARIMFKERLRPGAIVGALMAVAGVAVLFLH